MQGATDYAKQQADIFKQSLQYLIDQENEQKKNAQQLATQNYENIINQLNQNKIPIEAQYQENARQAYVNKVLAGKKLESDLTRLGLDTTGFALTQKIYNENQYSSNLNKLALDKAAGLRDIENDITNARGQLASDLLNLEVDYGDRLTKLNQYITEQVDQKYNDAYNIFFTNKQYEDKLKQQEWENQMAERQYNDALKQQAIKNQQNWHTAYNSGPSGTKFNSPSGETKPSNPVQAQDDVTFVRAMGTVTAAKDLGFDITGLPTNQSIKEYKDKKGNIYYLVYSPDDKSYIDITDEFEKFKEKLKKQEQNKNVSKPTGTSNYSKPTLVNKPTFVNKPTTANTKNGIKVNNYVNASLRGTTNNFLKNNSNKMYTGKK